MAGPIKISELPLVSSSNDVDEIPLVQGGVTRKIALSNLPEGIGIAIGTDVLAEQTIGIADNNLLEVDDPAAASGQFSRFTANGLEGRTEAEFKADVNLEIGTDVQAYDATLSSLAALGTAADKIAYSTDVDTWAETPLTAAGRSLIDDASVADMRATLGAGTSDYSDPLTTRGDLLYRDSSNVTNRLPVGATDSFLGGDGTDTAYVLAATQAEQETGTATNKPVTPGRQQFHQSAAKAWVRFDGTGTVAIDESYNVTSITDNGTGDYTINFTTNFSNATYTCTGLAGESGATFGKLQVKGGVAPTASAFRCMTVNTSGAGEDTSFIGLAFFGDQ